MREKLDAVLPKVCAYFGRDDFMNIKIELERHDKNVIKHYLKFAETQHAWGKISRYLTENR
ncbi:hypothetical protein SDC9_181419 [bioreactor metagenome]|uniref:Uncharacterized protein n=1 Tax=bioreactor metagenome TaxID=1076179 RepID=A0A645H4J8_9ZZZZ